MRYCFHFAGAVDFKVYYKLVPNHLMYDARVVNHDYAKRSSFKIHK